MESLCNKNPNYEEKGVGLLPDSILVFILSLLPLKVAVRTSILCQRWRYLWTRVTAFDVDLLSYNETKPSFYSVMRRLTSPILRRLCVISNNPCTVSDPRCFKLACDRKVEEIQVTLMTLTYFHVPPCIFQCKTLVNLVLDITLFYIFDNIAMLLESCPLLEVLDMNVDCPLSSPLICIIAPNLKSLSFKMRNVIDQHQVIIDAPKLTYVYVISGGLVINFVKDPTVLDTAHIDLTYLSFRGMLEGMHGNGFICQICKFMARLSNVHELHLESNMKLFAYMHLVGSMPLFGNLSYARMILSRSSGVNEFLLFLQIAPNLKEVFVTLNYDEGNPLADMRQSAVVVPGLLLNNLECVNITGLQGNNDEVSLVGYILKNAIGLNHLYILVDVDNAAEDEDARHHFTKNVPAP
ncbi:hypothetical protein RDABS01_004737 [Bienertia sinuspersici]